jgi:hypothetical protein
MNSLGKYRAFKKLFVFTRVITVAAIMVLPALPGSAQTASGGSGALSAINGYFTNWFERVDATLAEQPHWAPPVATTSPRLQEVLRYDIMWQSLHGDHDLVNYGSAKGFEFIPSEHLQFIVGIPPYETQNSGPRKSGWGDQMFLMKYRFAAGNEENGNYLLTGFMGVSVPNGGNAFSAKRFVYSPTLAGGKGWGNFDIQGTVGASFPDNFAVHTGTGTPVLANCILQYRIAKVIWPEVEANYTYWPNGIHEGLNQLLITPGLVVGRFPIYGRVACMFGVGCQIAVTDGPLYHRNVIFTARMPF